MLLKVDFRAEDYGLGETFADGFLVLVNLTVPVLVLLTLLVSMGQDLYMHSVGRLMGRPQQALLDAIARRQQHREKSASLPHDVAAPAYEPDLSAESTEVSRRREAYD